MKITLLSGLIALSLFSAAHAQTAAAYPATAIPNFKCSAGIYLFVLDRTGKVSSTELETLDLGEVTPIYVADPKGPSQIPASTNLTRFKKFPIFARAQVVFHSYTKDALGNPSNTMSISVFGSFGDQANPIFPQKYPQPIGTTYLKDVNWPLAKNLDAVYASDIFNESERVSYSFFTYCAVKDAKPSSEALTTIPSKTGIGMMKAGNQLIPIVR